MNIFLGLIPEAIFFSLFIIFTKNYKDKTKNIVFTLLMIIGYILLKQILPRNVYCQIIYLIYVPFLMFSLYKEKFHISDIFIFMLSADILVLFSFVIAFACVYQSLLIYWIAYIINRILIFGFLLLFKNKLNKFYISIISQWNRNREKPNKIKALTIRNVCVLLLNIGIFLAYLGMILSDIVMK